MKFLCRKAKIEDAKEMHAIRLLLTRRGEFEGTVKQANKRDRSTKKYIIKGNPVHFFVCTTPRNNVVGYTAYASYSFAGPKKYFRAKPKSAFFVCTAVHPKYRGRGIATSVKATTIADARKRYHFMYTTMAASNVASQKANKKNGFKQMYRYNDNKRKNGEDTLLFMKKL